MLIELYIFYEILVIVLFFVAFFTKQEIIWGISAVLSGALMFSSFDVQTYVYIFNATIGAYSPEMFTNHYMYLVWINGLFFVLSLVLGIFDMFDKYGTKLLKRDDEEEK